MTSTPAIWNRKPFSCPGPCGRHFGVEQIRIKHVRNEWMCQQCADRLTGRAHLDNDRPDMTCATCGQPATSGRRTINGEGRIVHRGGCPSKTETSRRRERRRKSVQ